MVSVLLSKLLGERYKEKPADAVLDSHIFLLRGGYLHPVSNGIYSLLTPARRITRKLENIIREEMDGIGGQEVCSRRTSGRALAGIGAVIKRGERALRFRGHREDMLLGMTHEERPSIWRGERKPIRNTPL